MWHTGCNSGHGPGSADLPWCNAQGRSSGSRRRHPLATPPWHRGLCPRRPWSCLRSAGSSRRPATSFKRGDSKEAFAQYSAAIVKLKAADYLLTDPDASDARMRGTQASCARRPPLPLPPLGGRMLQLFATCHPADAAGGDALFEQSCCGTQAAAVGAGEPPTYGCRNACCFWVGACDEPLCGTLAFKPQTPPLCLPLLLQAVHDGSCAMALILVKGLSDAGATKRMMH